MDKKQGNAAREAAPAIPDTPENIARAILLGPPKEEWRYLEEERAAESEPPPRG